MRGKLESASAGGAVADADEKHLLINGFSVEGLCVSNAAMGIAAVREELRKEEFLPHVDIQDALDHPLLLAD